MSRKDRRAANSKNKRVAKHVAKAMGVKLPELLRQSSDPTNMALRLTSIEDWIAKFNEAHRENLKGLFQAFTMVDAHIYVLQRLQADFLASKTQLKDGRIDVDHYYEQLNLMRENPNAYSLWAARGMTVEEALAAATPYKQGAEAPEPAIVEPAASTAGTTEVFGGDYEAG
jgi:hypothetical protein